MTQQGMNLPPHRPPNIDKPEPIPDKIKETWDSILQFNRIQKFPYTNLETGRIEWDNGEIIQYQYLPREIRYEWDKILAKQQRLQMKRGYDSTIDQSQLNPFPTVTLHPQHYHYGMDFNNQLHQHGGLPHNVPQYQWRSLQYNLVPLDLLEVNPQHSNLQMWLWMRDNSQWNSLYLQQDRWPL